VVDSNVLTIVVTTIFIQNILLSQFLGLCPFIGVSNHKKNALGMGLATTLVLTLTASLTYPIWHFILIPFELTYLKTLTLILVIAASVQALELTLRIVSPLLHQTLGLYLPLITSNCAVLGVALLVINSDFDSWLQATAFGASAGIGFALVLLLLTQLRHQIQNPRVPKIWQGSPIGLVTAGIMSLAFMGLQGL